jgi:hypothetical protein
MSCCEHGGEPLRSIFLEQLSNCRFPKKDMGNATEIRLITSANLKSILAIHGSKPARMDAARNLPRGSGGARKSALENYIWEVEHYFYCSPCNNQQ